MKNSILITYARFSPRPNAKDCDSILKQHADFRQWAAQNGYQDVNLDHFDEAKSGSDRTRSGLTAAIKACRKGDVLLVRDWSRLSRDIFTQIEVARKLSLRGIRLTSVQEGDWEDSDNPIVELLNTVLAAFAQYQRQMIGKTTKARMLKHQSEGRFMGGTPYGFKRVGESELVAIPEQQAIIQQIWTHWTNGESLGRIKTRIESYSAKRALNDQKWNRSAIYRIIKREARSRGVDFRAAQHSHHSGETVDNHSQPATA